MHIVPKETQQKYVKLKKNRLSDWHLSRVWYDAAHTIFKLHLKNKNVSLDPIALYPYLKDVYDSSAVKKFP